MRTIANEEIDLSNQSFDILKDDLLSYDHPLPIGLETDDKHENDVHTTNVDEEFCEIREDLNFDLNFECIHYEEFLNEESLIDPYVNPSTYTDRFFPMHTDSNEITATINETLDVRTVTTKIWKGDFISSICSFVELTETFQLNPAVYAFTAYVEIRRNRCDAVFLSPKDHKEWIKVDFQKDYFDFGEFPREPNRVKIDIHQDCIEVGDEVRIIVEAKSTSRINDKEILLFVGATNAIRVTKYALSIDSWFTTKNKQVRALDEEKLLYAWYNASGGEFFGLDCVIRLRDEKGRECSVDQLLRGTDEHWMKTSYTNDAFFLEVVADLIYADDGSEVPRKRKKPTPGRKRGKLISSSSFRQFSTGEDTFFPTRLNPMKFGKEDSCRPFSFRVEEVSRNHDNRSFKLRVRAKHGNGNNLQHLFSENITDGIMWESIFVQSKESASTKKRNSLPNMRTMERSFLSG